LGDKNISKNFKFNFIAAKHDPSTGTMAITHPADASLGDPLFPQAEKEGLESFLIPSFRRRRREGGRAKQ